VFPCGDGDLYRLEFGAPGGSDVVERKARRLRWLCPRPPGDGWQFISEPGGAAAMPGGPWIFASVSYRDGAAPRTVVRLWWLRLSPDGGSVEQAGPLTPPDGGLTQYRAPAVAATADGGFSLACLARVPGDEGWSVRLAPGTFAPSLGEPSVKWGQARTVATGLSVNPPAFSPDGRTVFVASVREKYPLRVVRRANPFLGTAGDLPAGPEGWPSASRGNLGAAPRADATAEMNDEGVFALRGNEVGPRWKRGPDLVMRRLEFSTPVRSGDRG
jgi:hypothetical protein